jgi:hypothetical protein
MIGGPLNAALNTGGDMPNSSRDSLRASLRLTVHAANAGSPGGVANR